MRGMFKIVESVLGTIVRRNLCDVLSQLRQNLRIELHRTAADSVILLLVCQRGRRIVVTRHVDRFDDFVTNVFAFRRNPFDDDRFAAAVVAIIIHRRQKYRFVRVAV